MSAVVPLDDERRLVKAAQGGDRAALEQLLREHQPRIHAVCRRITGSDADALDATQETLMAIVRGLGRFDGRSRFSTWAFRIATNASLDELRRRGRRPVVGLPEHDGIVGEPVDPRSVGLAEQVVDQDEVDQALAQIPAEFRVAVVLRDLCQLDYADIAQVLEIPPGTVRSRIARGRTQLADLLAGNQTHPAQRPTPEP